MAQHRQTRNELEEHLRDACRLLRASAASYDAGEPAESKRIATQIRVLLHDTSVSHSLLNLLGIKTALQFIDTAYPVSPMSLISHSGLTGMRTTAGGPEAGGTDEYQPGP